MPSSPYGFRIPSSLCLQRSRQGGVFGNATGVATGYEASLSYKRIMLSSSGEYLFDTKNKNGGFFYSGPHWTYSPLDWFHVGHVAQRTKAYHES